MVRRTSALVFIAVCCTGLLAADDKSSGPSSPKNLVNNSSLEEKVGLNESPPGWGQFYAQPAGAYTYSVVEGGRTGKKAMRVSGKGTFGAMPANRIEIDPNKRYAARGWIKLKGDADATADVKFHYYGADGRYLDQTRVGYVSPTTDQWQFVTVTDQAAKFPQAKFIGLAFAVTGKAEALFDDLELIPFDKADLPKDFEADYGITRSPQLALLGRRIGDWTTETTIKPCAWVPQGAKSTGVESVRWTLGGQYIEVRARNETQGSESLVLMTFDPKASVYRLWNFDSGGNVSNLTGSWDDATQTFELAGVDEKQVQIKVRLTLSGNDAVKWTGTWTDKDGKLLLDVEAASKRKGT